MSGNRSLLEELKVYSCVLSSFLCVINISFDIKPPYPTIYPYLSVVAPSTMESVLALLSLPTVTPLI